VSLHGANDKTRDQLMPVNKVYPLASLINACHEYAEKTKRQITFEYVLIQGLTSTPKAAEELAKLLKGLLCKINLIPYNKVTEFNFDPPTAKEIEGFKNQLDRLGIHSTLRIPRGRDIAAACGQLRHLANH
jgi:23S rRNA (adenine2503-C2)-methyltransferase